MSGKNQKKYIANRKKSGMNQSAHTDAVQLSKAMPAAAGKGQQKNSSKTKTLPPSPLFDKNNLMELFARVFLLAMVFIFPLAMGTEKYANITHYKNSIFYVLAALGLCSVIVSMIIKVISTPADNFKVVLPKFNLPDYAVLLYWGFLFISTLLSPYKDIAFNGQGVRNDGFIIQSFYVAVYFLISHLLKLRKFDLNVYCLGATIVAGLVNQDLTPLLPQIQASTLLIWGENDTETPLWMGQKMEQDIPDAGIVALGVVLLAGMPLMLISMHRLGRYLAVLSVALGVIAFNRLVVETWILEEDFGKPGYLMICAAILLAAASVFFCCILLLLPSF